MVVAAFIAARRIRRGPSANGGEVCKSGGIGGSGGEVVAVGACLQNAAGAGNTEDAWTCMGIGTGLPDHPRC